MIVYHGSTEIIKNPDVVHSKKYLDFGMDFTLQLLKIRIFIYRFMLKSYLARFDLFISTIIYFL